MAMPYLASPLSLGNLQGVDYLNTMPGMDLPEQQPNFESEAFVRCVSPALSFSCSDYYSYPSLPCFFLKPSNLPSIPKIALS